MTFDGITLVGLGPGDPALITRQAWDILASSKEVYFNRKCGHLLNAISGETEIHFINELIDVEVSSSQKSDYLLDSIVSLGKRPGGLVYAVLGNPVMDDSLSIEIIQKESELDIPVRVFPGLSYLDSIIYDLNMDPFSRYVVWDARDLVMQHVPPFPPGVPVIAAQLHLVEDLSKIGSMLIGHYPGSHPLKLISTAETGEICVKEIGLDEIEWNTPSGTLISLYIPPLDIRNSFEAFLEVVARLRAPDGCPWDRKQTYQSLRSDLLEEAYEALDAIDTGDLEHLCEELGDLILLILMLTQIASENGEFNIGDVLHGIHMKIVRRHPHVFGELKADDEHEVTRLWEKVKAAERGGNEKSQKSLLGGVSAALPALAQAQAYQKRVERVGFDWPDIGGVVEKLLEEIHEMQSAVGNEAYGKELGDLLFSIVNLARWKGIDAESALRESNGRFFARFSHMEKAAAEQGRSLQDMTLVEMESLWQKAKRMLTSEDDTGHQ